MPKPHWRKKTLNISLNMKRKYFSHEIKEAVHIPHEFSPAGLPALFFYPFRNSNQTHHCN